MLQLPYGAVSSACNMSLAHSFPPPAGEFLSLFVLYVQAARWDVIKDGLEDRVSPCALLASWLSRYGLRGLGGFLLFYMRAF